MQRFHGPARSALFVFLFLAGAVLGAYAQAMTSATSVDGTISASRSRARSPASKSPEHPLRAKASVLPGEK